MKSILFFATALFFGAAAMAQTTTPPTQDTATVVLIDSSIGKAYVTHPERLQGLTSETITPANIFPALGTYKSTGSSSEEVTVTLDETNKGIVWVEGLPQGRFKALMKQAPSTYKIPAQKTESGKAVAEGTLYLNPDTNELTIILGQTFNDQNPTSFMNVAATKKAKAWQYTGVRTSAASTNAASQQ